MTKYVGGKARIAKYIHDVILDIEKELIDKKLIDHQLDYLEPFCGMCSVALKFANDRRLAQSNRCITVSDLNSNIVFFFEGMKNKIKPPKFIDQTEYDILKASPTPSFEKTYVGFQWSFGGGWFAGYSGRYLSPFLNRRTGENCYDKILRIQNNLMEYITIGGIKDYKSYDPNNNLIYLDPPYLRSKSLNNKFLLGFNSDEFWEIVYKWSKNNLVFVSESKDHIPDKWKDEYTIVWEKKIFRTINKVNNGCYSIDCLFLHNSWADKITLKNKRNV